MPPVRAEMHGAEAGTPRRVSIGLSVHVRAAPSTSGCGRGRTRFVLGPIAGQQVLVHPRNGSFGAADQTATAYRPNPGYLGKDYFETRIYFEQGNGKRTFMTLKVHVLVAPTLGFK